MIIEANNHNNFDVEIKHKVCICIFFKENLFLNKVQEEPDVSENHCTTQLMYNVYIF